MNHPIVSGQQIGLLGGPLYVPYKVLGAVHLANKLKEPAVYWLETNDADFNEINHIHYLDADNQLKSLTWDIDTEGYSCGYIEVDDSLVQLLETYFSTIRQTEFTPALKELALDCYRKGRTLAEASLCLAEALYGHLDLRFFTPFENEFREFSQSILRREAERTPEGEQCNLFCMMNKQRKALFRENGAFILRDGTQVDITAYDLVPNVKTRSICQDAYFKTHSYIAGPGEVKYLSELGPNYAFHGVKQATVQPRMSLTLLEPVAKRILKKRDFKLQEFLDTPKEILLKNVMAQQSGFDLKQITEQANELTGTYIEKLETLGFDAADIKSLRKFLQMEIKKNTGKMRARYKEKHDRLLKDTAYLSDCLRPYGNKQERVFNLFYYMNLYGGKELIDRIYREYDFRGGTLEL